MTKIKDKFKKYSYKVSTLLKMELFTQDSVWNEIEKLAVERTVIPQNTDDLRKIHEKKIETLISNNYIDNPKAKLKQSIFTRNQVLLDSIRNGYTLSLNKYGADIPNDVVYYFTRKTLHELYLIIAWEVSLNYKMDDFEHVSIPEPEQYLSKKAKELIKQTEAEKSELIKKLDSISGMLSFLKIKREISGKDIYIQTIKSNAYEFLKFNEEQSMAYFLSSEINFASITFLKNVIRYHLQQQATEKKKHSKAKRDFINNNRHLVVVKENVIKEYIIRKYYENNPKAGLKDASELLKIDPKTIKKYKPNEVNADTDRINQNTINVSKLDINKFRLNCYFTENPKSTIATASKELDDIDYKIIEDYVSKRKN
ncbi:MAG: hypothetical protein KQH79_01070 [Bacteroidetes bacterium]|nr:hypothetical protein [Bacteroidota bacterium]